MPYFAIVIIVAAAGVGIYTILAPLNSLFGLIVATVVVLLTLIVVVK